MSGIISLQSLYGTGGATRGKARIFARSGTVGTSYEKVNVYATDLDQYSILAGTAAAADVISSSTDDDGAPVGTGARTVTVYGLDAAYSPVSETVTMNGQTAVTTTQTFLRVHGAKVATAGSGQVNAGDIYVYKTGTGGSISSGVPGTLTSAFVKILAGFGQCVDGSWTSPAGAQYKLARLIFGGSGQAFTLGMFVRPLSGAAATQNLACVGEWDNFTTGLREARLDKIAPFTVLTDVVFKAKSATGSALVSVDAYFEKV